MFIEEVIGAFTGENRRTRHRQVANTGQVCLIRLYIFRYLQEAILCLLKKS